MREVITKSAGLTTFYITNNEEIAKKYGIAVITVIRNYLKVKCNNGAAYIKERWVLLIICKRRVAMQTFKSIK